MPPRALKPPLRGALAAVALATSGVLPVLGVAAPAAAGQAAADVRMLGTDREPAGDPFSFVGTGLPGGFRFFDGDLPPDLKGVAVRVASTTDPVGIPVWATRSARASAYYEGTFSFATASSDPVAGAIAVASGDQVTMTYADATSSDGLPATVEASAPWWAGSAQPDEREVSFSNASTGSTASMTDGGTPVVRGAWRAVAPGADVRVYESATDPSPVGEGTAGVDGSFEVTMPALTTPPPELWVTAVESGQPESVRTRVGWAAVTGRVVLPELGSPPVLNALVAVDPPGCRTTNECPGGGISDHGGRYDIDTTRSNFPGAGDYDVSVDQQSLVNPAAPPPWRSSAYGDPPTRRVTVASAAVTTDLGDVALLPPNVHGRVHAGLFAIPEAGLWIQSPSGENLPGGGYTRDDGRFALHMTDGDYVLWVRPQFGCGGYREARVAIAVRDGVATPANIDLDVAIGNQGVLPATAPIVAIDGMPVAVDMLSPAGPVSVSLDGASGEGSITAGCASLGELPDLRVVAPPVDLTSPGLAFTSSEVCVGYDSEALSAQGVDPAQLHLYHFAADGRHQPITTVRDLAGHQLCGRTTSFSPFALAVPTGAPPSETTTTTTTTTSTPTTTSPLPVAPAPAPATRSGYWMVAGDGAVYAFGDARSYGGAPVGATRAVDLERTTSGNGYWVVDALGHVFSFGDAGYHGGAPGLRGGEAITSLSRTVDSGGYWLFTTHGRALSYGNASWYGDVGQLRLNGPVLDSIPTPSGRGYYLVASDGGIFAFGDARFRGSMGATRLNAPVQSLVPDADGDGYWLVASDGGIFSFAATFHGSMGSVPLNKPVTGMVGQRKGYLMIAEDGGVFAFGEAQFHGSLGSNPPPHPVTSVTAL